MNVFDNESVHYEADITIIDNDVTPGLISEKLYEWEVMEEIIVFAFAANLFLGVVIRLV